MPLEPVDTRSLAKELLLLAETLKAAMEVAAIFLPTFWDRVSEGLDRCEEFLPSNPNIADCSLEVRGLLRQIKERLAWFRDVYRGCMLAGYDSEQFPLDVGYFYSAIHELARELENVDSPAGTKVVKPNGIDGEGKKAPLLDVPEEERNPEAGDAAVTTTWQDVAKRLENRRVQGDPWTSMAVMAKEIGCSPATVQKAVNNTPSLQAWATKRPAENVTARRLTEVVADGTASRTASPEDEAAIREFVEASAPEVKAWFLSLSIDDQISHLESTDLDDTKGEYGRRLVRKKERQDMYPRA